MDTQTKDNLLSQIEELQNRLAQANELIATIKVEKIDAFALNNTDNPEVSIPQNGDYAYRTANFDETEHKFSPANKEHKLESNVARLFMQAPAIICIHKGPQHVFELSNILHQQAIDNRDIVGKPVREAFPELEGQAFFEILDTVYATGKPYMGYEVPVLLTRDNKKQEEAYFNFVYQPTMNDDGEVDGILAHGVDVTEQVLTRKKIEESEFRFQNLIYTSPSLIAIFKGEDLIIEIANDAIIESWGKGKDVIGKPLIKVMPEIVAQGFEKLMLDVYTTGKPYYANETPVTLIKNGISELMYYTFIYQAQHNANGDIEGVAVIGNEVTLKVELNNKLKISEAFNRTVLESSPDCIKMLDENGRLQFMNANGVCLLEIDDFKSVKNTYWWEMWEPHNQQIIKDAVETAKSGQKIQLQLFSPTSKGTPKWWDIIVLPVLHDGSNENNHRILSVSRDITKQKESEIKEKELLARFQTLVIQAPVAMCVVSVKNNVIEIINDRMLGMWDKSLGQVIYKPAFEVLPEFSKQGFNEILDTVYKTSKRFVAEELYIDLIRNGKIEKAFVKFVFEPLLQADGMVSEVMVLAHEITEQVETRKKIEESKLYYETLTDNTPVMTWITRTSGQTTFLNKQWYNYTGQTKEEGLGLGWLSAIHPDDTKQSEKIFLNANENKIAFSLTYRLRSKNGEYRWHLDSGLPKFDDDNNYEGMIGSVTDIHESVLTRDKVEESRKQLKLLKEQLDFSLSAGKIGVWNFSKPTNYLYWSKEQCDIYGITENEFGNHLNDFVKFVNPTDLIQINKQIEKGYQLQQAELAYQFRITRADGVERWIECRSRTKYDLDGNPEFTTGINVDITDDKLFSIELEKKVAERTHELEQKNNELLVMNKELEAFNYISSHDLQEPLRKIQTFTGRIITKENANLSDNAKDYFNRIQDSANRMQTLIQDLLAFSRVSTLERKFEKVNLLKIVEEVKAEFSEALEEKSGSIQTSEMCTTNIIPFQFQQLFQNLISNALKFSKPNVPPIISIKSKVVIGDNSPFNGKKACQISIADNGIGFDKQFAERIFGVFQKLHGKEEYAGTGIGLAIVKKIVDNHNGIITAESELGKGATFIIYLPE